MGLFDKKTCDLCGKKYGLLGGKKLEDGLICKDCLKDASPWLGSAKQQSVDDMKRHLAYREGNQKALEGFLPNRSIGSDMKIFVDDRQGLFALARGDYSKINADLLRFDQLLSINFRVDETRQDLSDNEKKNQSAPVGQALGSMGYNQQGLNQLEFALGLTPGLDQNGRACDERNYKYSYRFDFTLDINHEWINQIRFNISDGFSKNRHSSEFQSAASTAIALRDALQSIQFAARNMATGMGSPAMPGVGQGMQHAQGQVPLAQTPLYGQVVPGQTSVSGQVPSGQSPAYGQQNQANAQYGQVPNFGQDGNFALQNMQANVSVQRCPYCGSDYVAQRDATCPGCHAPIGAM